MKSGTQNVAVEDSLHRKVKKMADARGMKLKALIERLLRLGIKHLKEGE